MLVYKIGSTPTKANQRRVDKKTLQDDDVIIRRGIQRRSKTTIVKNPVK